MTAERTPLTEADDDFQQRLQKLRLKIDTLPAAQRPHLIELAETIARQHRRLQRREAHHHDAG